MLCLDVCKTCIRKHLQGSFLRDTSHTKHCNRLYFLCCNLILIVLLRTKLKPAKYITKYNYNDDCNDNSRCYTGNRNCFPDTWINAIRIFLFF